jgi:hypothetical protein
MAANVTCEMDSAARRCPPCCSATAVSTSCVWPASWRSIRSASAASAGLPRICVPSATVVSEHRIGACASCRRAWRATAASSFRPVTRTIVTRGFTGQHGLDGLGILGHIALHIGQQQDMAHPICSSNWLRRGLCEAR